MPPRQRNIRKRQKEVSSSDDEEASPAPDALRDTKLVQALRKKSKGIDSSVLAKGEGERGFQATAGTQDEEVDEGVDLHAGYVKKVEVKRKGAEDHMQEFIDQEVSKRLGKIHEDGGDGAGPSTKWAHKLKGRLEAGPEEDALYDTPEDLDAKKSKEVIIPGFNHSITEVQLPADYVIANVEETEAAKRRLMAAHVAAQGVQLPDDEEEDDEGPARIGRGAFPKNFGFKRRK